MKNGTRNSRVVLHVLLRNNQPPEGVYVYGGLIGLLYALLAFGLMLIYRANRFISFAIGAFDWSIVTWHVGQTTSPSSSFSVGCRSLAAATGTSASARTAAATPLT